MNTSGFQIEGPATQLQSRTACIQSPSTFTIFEKKPSVIFCNYSEFTGLRPGSFSNHVRSRDEQLS